MKRRTCRNKSKRPSGRFFIVLFPAVFLIVLGQGSTAFAQKRVSRTLLDPEVRSIAIDGSQCFAISLETAPTDEVTVEASMEGEYRSEVLVQTETLGGTLLISTGLSPAFDLPNDKLGAHKVLSVRLRIVLPEDQRVTLSAGRCQVETSGHYEELQVRINEGGCRLDHRAATTRVRTFSAPITARIAEGEVLAESRHGRVQIDPIPAGNSRFMLSSNSGDIQVHARL
ncbi:hypothetical protein [Robiginitalea sp. SC105]|uniref:hypothetical protein n=1 Tax=Robiginitalea sp. SC105 TaxID=2762332 RepID=UPI00163A0AA8|nr:hypothetical protein [Robiginitalea sp. SC105]MBC2838013.1 hypothetical protein [Robiginitalea sp. SC105]